MIKFDYDNIEAEKINLEFKCIGCNKMTKTELLDVPLLDIETFTETKCSYQHKCVCGDIYPIDLYNGVYGSYGIIHRIDGNEKDVFVHEFPDVPYNKDSILTDTIHTYSMLESVIEKIDDLSKDEKRYIYGLLFSNLITLLDSFIKIYTEPIVLSERMLIENFIASFEMKSGTEEENKEKIRNVYSRKSFQSVANQKKLFEEVFNISIEIDYRIELYVAIRDVIIHRNFIDKAGFIHNIKKSQLLEALEVIKKYIRHIYSALLTFEIDILLEKINTK